MEIPDNLKDPTDKKVETTQTEKTTTKLKVEELNQKIEQKVLDEPEEKIKKNLNSTQQEIKENQHEKLQNKTDQQVPNKTNSTNL